jgi:hypothetical protein
MFDLLRIEWELTKYVGNSRAAADTAPLIPAMKSSPPA